MRVILPNGTPLDNIPEGTSKLEIAQKAIKNGLATAEDFGGFVPEAWEQNPEYSAGVNPIAGNAQALLSGATFGLSDEAQAAIAASYTRADPTGKEHMPGTTWVDRYRQARDQIRADARRFREQEGALAYVPEAIGALATGGYGLAKAGPTLPGIIKGGAMEGAIAGLGYSEGETPGEVASDMALSTGLGAAGGPVVVGAGRVLKKPLQGAVNAVRRRFPNTPVVGKSVAQEIADAGEMKPNIAAEFVDDGGRLAKDSLWPIAKQQGIQPGTVNSIKAMSRADKNKSKLMLQAVENWQGSDYSRMFERPSKWVGETMSDKFQFVRQRAQRFGKQLDAFANSQLKGSLADLRPAMRGFQDALERRGVQFTQNDAGDIVLNFKGSDIVKKDRGPIKAVVDYFNTNTKQRPLDALGAHRFKGVIDDNIPWDAQNKMTSKGESIMKGLRRAINKELQDNFDGYAQINSKLEDTINARNQLVEAVNIKVDINSEDAARALGQEARILFTNYKNAPRMAKAVRDLENIAEKYGLKSNESIHQQAVFLNSLQDMFGSEAAAGFEALASRGVRRGIEAAATGGKSEAIRHTVPHIVDAASGVSTEQKIKVLRQLLNR